MGAVSLAHMLGGKRTLLDDLHHAVILMWLCCGQTPVPQPLSQEPAESDWPGERGRVSAELLRRVVPTLAAGPVYLCGPDAMMAATTAPTGFVSIRFATSKRSAEVPRASTVLEAAESIGLDLPHECRSGICGQRKTRLVAGEVTMESENALTPGDRAKGMILACQAHAKGDVVVEA